MIQELVDKINEAEKQADGMIAAALEEAKAMNFDADAEAAKIIAEAKAKIKRDRKKVIESAEKQAEERYNEIIAIGEREAAKLIGTVDVSAEAKAIAEAYCKQYER